MLSRTLHPRGIAQTSDRCSTKCEGFMEHSINLTFGLLEQLPRDLKADAPVGTCHERYAPRIEVAPLCIFSRNETHGTATASMTAG